MQIKQEHKMILKRFLKKLTCLLWDEISHTHFLWRSGMFFNLWNHTACSIKQGAISMEEVSLLIVKGNERFYVE